MSSVTIFQKPVSLNPGTTHYCPGCTHGIIHRLIAEIMDELDIRKRTVGIAPVGCSVLAYDYFNCDFHEASHGRAPAVATGIKRCWPDKYVFSYQGDGDLAAIGTSEIIHACNRGENIAIFFINNGIYGMTGGQMAPTTLEGMRSSTTPYGRDVKLMGNPLKITELVAMLPGTYYVSRQSVHTALNVRKFKKAAIMAFENQKLKKGLSFIEVVSNCNSGWKMSPVEANKWMEENMFPFYPIGNIKVNGEIVQRN